MDESSNVRYNTILGQYMLTDLGLNLKSSDHVIKVDDGPFKGSTTPMVYLVTYVYKDLNTGRLHTDNILLMVILRKYMSQDISVIPLYNYV